MTSSSTPSLALNIPTKQRYRLEFAGYGGGSALPENTDEYFYTWSMDDKYVVRYKKVYIDEKVEPSNNSTEQSSSSSSSSCKSNDSYNSNVLPIFLQSLLDERKRIKEEIMNKLTDMKLKQLNVNKVLINSMYGYTKEDSVETRSR